MVKMHCALGAWIFRVPHFSNPNWWYKWIGEEVDLQTMFLLLGTNRTSPVEQQTLTEFSYNSAWWINQFGGGDNLSDMLRVQLYRGIATSNLTAVSQSFSATYNTSIIGHVTDGVQGVMDDLSYHFHTGQLLNSAYGLGWVDTMLSTINITAGTQWEIPPAPVAVLGRFLVEGDLALTFGRRWDFGTQGRGIDRPAAAGSSFGWGFLASALRGLAGMAAAAPWAAGLSAFADLQEGRLPQEPLLLLSSKYFWTVDFYAHKRPNWGATFKGYGDNGLWSVIGNECDNGENIKGEYTAAGILNVYSSGELDTAVESYGNIFPLWDWVRINGVSAEAREPILCSAETGDVWPVKNTAFVGGASDGQSGVVAHDFHLHNLTGQRSFFFLENALLALASNLTNNPSPLPVRTALVSRLLPDPSKDAARGQVSICFTNGTTVDSLAEGSYSFPAGSVVWVNGGGVGVLPFSNALVPGAPHPPMSLELTQKSGNFNTFGPFHSQVTGRLFTLTYEHGVLSSSSVAPDKLPAASFSFYSYALTPNSTAAQMPALAAASTVQYLQCLVLTPTLHVAATAGEGDSVLVSGVVWGEGGDGSSQYPGCSELGVGALSFRGGQGIFLLRWNSTHVHATASHPALSAAGGVRVVAQGKSLLPSLGCSGFEITLGLPPKGPFMGASTTVTCALA